MNLEKDILKQALDALAQGAGVRLEMLEQVAPYPANRARRADAVLRLHPDGKPLAAEVKKRIQPTNLGVMINQVREFEQDGILVADYVNPRMAERLKREGIQYMDTVGNAYLNQPGQFVYIKGNPAPKIVYPAVTDIAHRAFEPRALGVVYAFLCDERMVDEPYRAIAERTGVAVGTVGWVIRALKAGRFIRRRHPDGGRNLVNRKELLDRWTEAWPGKLKHKLLIGMFRTEDPFWWKEIDITRHGGLWGGEVAAAKYTQYLRPKDTTVYIQKEATTKLFQEARLRRVRDWERPGDPTTYVYRPFWPDAAGDHAANHAGEKDLAHPVLVYADLMASGDPRNMETARVLYEQQIHDQYIRED